SGTCGLSQNSTTASGVNHGVSVTHLSRNGCAGGARSSFHFELGGVEFLGQFGNVQIFQVQRFGVDLFQVNRDGFTVVGAKLDSQGLVFGQHFHSVELSLFGNAVDFGQTLVDFSLDRSQVGFGVGAGGRLHAQSTDALQVVVDFVQRTFGGLSDRDTVVGVAGSLCQTVHVGGEAVGNSLTGGVVFSAVDAQT